MAEYISRKTVLDILSSKNAPWDGYQKVSELHAADVVSKAAYDQVVWERNMAEEQLKSIDKSIGEKMEDVQPVKHGQWVQDAVYVDETTGEPCLAWFCNQCGEPQMVGTNYCPNCGAKMDGET